MRKPIVTTDVPGCRDVVEPRINGLLVPPRDPRALAEAVEMLLMDSALRERFGKASRELTVREFDEQKVVGQILSRNRSGG